MSKLQSMTSFEQNSLVLSLGQCLAAGGLLGDVFLHSIPHSGGEGNHDVGLWILFGFSIFLIVDMIMRSISSSSSSHNHHQHGGKKKNRNDEDMKIEKQGESNASTILLNLTADALHNVSFNQKQTKNCIRRPIIFNVFVVIIF